MKPQPVCVPSPAHSKAGKEYAPALWWQADPGMMPGYAFGSCVHGSSSPLFEKQSSLSSGCPTSVSALRRYNEKRTRHAVALPSALSRERRSNRTWTPHMATRDTTPPAYIEGTPCFTAHIASSPMREADRNCYMQCAVDSVVSYARDFETGKREGNLLPHVANLTLLVPQLNPELDVYDRRFVLSLVWSLANALIFEAKLRTRVLIQGTGRYGAVPLSVAGLRRNFEADMKLSEDVWGGEDVMRTLLRTGDLEDPGAVEELDEVFIVVSPTNASGMPVVNDLMGMAERAGPKRLVICVNPRLKDVPSAAGVMGVGGRHDRMSFLDSFTYPFYLRLMYDAGTIYPLRCIVVREWPGKWQIWRPNEETTAYRLVLESEGRPSSEDISEALKADRRKQRVESGVSATGFDTVVSANLAVFSAVLVVGAAILASRANVIRFL